MDKFNEALKVVKDTIKTMMTKADISDADLEEFATLNKQVDELEKPHQELVEVHGKMKDKYIEAITNYGTRAKPDEVGSNSGKSLEEIANEVLKANKK